MAILTLQKTLVELGRIRIGSTEEYGDAGKRRPVKLGSFRFTTNSEDRANAVSTLYGGPVTRWSADGSDSGFEIVSPVTSLSVVLPPGTAVTQWYEMWSGGGCQRRCDGLRDVLADVPCQCPKDVDVRTKAAATGQACKPTTRVNVILPDLPGVGVWRLESHGYYAATELAGSAEFLARASTSGKPLPATLRLEQRSVIRPGRGGKPETRKYAVPVLDVGATVNELLEASTNTPAIEAADSAPRALAERAWAAQTTEELREVWRHASSLGVLACEVADVRTGVISPLSTIINSATLRIEPA